MLIFFVSSLFTSLFLSRSSVPSLHLFPLNVLLSLPLFWSSSFSLLYVFSFSHVLIMVLSISFHFILVCFSLLSFSSFSCVLLPFQLSFLHYPFTYLASASVSLLYPSHLPPFYVFSYFLPPLFACLFSSPLLASYSFL